MEGYAYGNDVLAVRLVRGAGLFGILNPPWMEYAIVGAFLLLAFIVLISVITRNSTKWKTGTIEEGEDETIILREEDGTRNRYTTDHDLYYYLISLNEQTVTVKIKKGQIIGVR